MTEQPDVAARNVATLRRYLDAINGWDFAAMRRLLHDEISYELPYAPEPFPRVTQGFDAVMAFLESVPDFAEEENLFNITINAFASEPNELVAEYRSDMKLTNGRLYKNTYVVRATIRDERIVRFVEYFDPVPLIVAIGGRVEVPAEG
jgi:ketosteroid isomerase-like protein